MKFKPAPIALLATSFAILAAILPLCGQTAIPAKPGEDETILLPAFTIQSEAESGYAATNCSRLAAATSPHPFGYHTPSGVTKRVEARPAPATLAARVPA